MALGVMAFLLKLLLGTVPGITERVYSKGFFVLVRYALDYTVGWSPVPFSYLLLLGLLGYWIIKWRRNRRAAPSPMRDRLLLALKNVGGFLGAAVFFFYVLWGYNYERIPIEQSLDLRLDSLTVEQLCEEAEWAARQAEAERALIPGITADSISEALVPDKLEEEVRTCVGRAMETMGFEMHGRIRGRMINPGGWMLRVGIAGIYNPFTGEGNVTGAQVPYKWPYTMAHEMSHACGWGDEGTCNFVGMIACSLSDDPFIRYSGMMGYWGQVANDIADLDPLLYKMLLNSLDAGVRADLKASYNNYMKYHGAIAQIGNRVNNAYLHLQGVRGGVKSYDRVVVMRAAYRSRIR